MRALFWTVAAILAAIGGFSGGPAVAIVLLVFAALLAPFLERN